MENVGLKNFWENKTVFLTGHTGFKGTWLSLWLTHKGAKVVGYALNPPTAPSLFELAQVKDIMHKSHIGDINDREKLEAAVLQSNPDIVIHMAAQPLVRTSYRDPVYTYQTNVMGTVYLMEAVRKCTSVKAVVNVTTDKCYDNKEWVWGYRENEALGGYDPYSSSKACSELVTSSYRNSFFNTERYEEHGVALASARAGNVIGGGDWAEDRLIPDIVRALTNNEVIKIRNPHAIRPWQHVLEPLNGYMLLCQYLYEFGPKYAQAWNFGPFDHDAKPVQWIVEKLLEKWSGPTLGYEVDSTGDHPHEAHYLKLDISKARQLLQWNPRWSLDQALDKIVTWTEASFSQSNNKIQEMTFKQIVEYENS